MRSIRFLLQKEFLQIFRNKTMLPVIFILPVVQLVVLAYAATFEIKRINLYVVDNNKSVTSNEFISKLKASSFFHITGTSQTLDEARTALKKDKADAIIHFQPDFEKQLYKEDKAQVQIIINAINGTLAGITQAYLTSISAEYNRNLIYNWYNMPEDEVLMEEIQIEHQYWFNPELNYQTYMVPGILVILVTIIGMFLAGLNLVREKEMGTIEQINVTPIHKYQFIAGKLIPFWLIALFDLSLGLFMGKVIFDIPIVGNLGVLYLVASVYLLLVLSIGLFISTVSQTQQQVMFLTYFFVLVFILMSGIFTAVESMPGWAQKLNLINPIFYFMKTIRMILLKGSGLKDIATEFVSLFVYAVLMLALATLKYRKINA